jgi:diguanylate cyclase (GGDEF)-like protein
VADRTSCRYCRAKLQADFNYCPSCGMPIDPTNDRPLFVVEGLTNLFNMVFFDSLFEQELNRASRYGHGLSVLVVEIDALGELEAAYGYEETTHLLREVGEVIAGAIRDPDTLAASRVAALGTQRFFVLLPETDEEGAFIAAERIRSQVASYLFQLSEGAVAVTVSLGVASTHAERDIDANLVGRATQALIESHQLGNNRIQVSAEI